MVLSALHSLTHLILFNPHKSLQDRAYYCSHFTDEETDPERLSTMSKGTKLERGRVSI